MIEELLKAKDMRFNCFNQGRGCEGEFGEDDLTFHCFQCIYRLVPCPNLFCKLKVPFNVLTEHMERTMCCTEDYYKLEKGVEIVRAQTLSPLLFNSFFPFSFLPVGLEFDEKLFYFTAEYLKDEKTFYFWIQLVGSKYDAKDYFYTLKIHGKNPMILATFTGQTIPIDQNTSTSFGVHIEAMRSQFLDENNQFIMSMSITKMTSEPKVEIVEMQESEFPQNRSSFGIQIQGN